MGQYILSQWALQERTTVENISQDTVSYLYLGGEKSLVCAQS